MGEVASRPECGRDLAGGDVGKSPTATFLENLEKKWGDASKRSFPERFVFVHEWERDFFEIFLLATWRRAIIFLRQRRRT
jgi:hypothetical protein